MVKKAIINVTYAEFLEPHEPLEDFRVLRGSTILDVEDEGGEQIILTIDVKEDKK